MCAESATCSAHSARGPSTAPARIAVPATNAVTRPRAGGGPQPKRRRSTPVARK